MAWMIPAAIVGSSLFGSKAASSAASTQADAAAKSAEVSKQISDQQIALAREQYNAQLLAQEPFRQGGLAAQNKLMRLLGISMPPNYNAMGGTSLVTEQGVTAPTAPTGTPTYVNGATYTPGTNYSPGSTFADGSYVNNAGHLLVPDKVDPSMYIDKGLANITPTPTPTVTPTPSAVIPTATIPGVTPTTPSAYDKTNIKQALNDAYVAKNTPLINQIIAENGLTQASVQAMYGLTPAQQATMLNTAGVNWTPAQSALSSGTFTPNLGTPTANKGLLGVGGNVWDATYGLVSPYAKLMNQMGTPTGGLLANPYEKAPIGSMGGYDVNKYIPLNEDIAAEIAKAKAAANAPIDSSVSPVAYMGGYIDKSRIAGLNPPGPDDGSTNIQVGEYVIKKSSVKKYGKGLLDMINEGTIPAKKIKSLLG